MKRESDNLRIQFEVNAESSTKGREAGLHKCRRSVCVSVLMYSTCLEASSVASCNGELVAPLCVAHVRHKFVVQGIT